MFSTNTTLAPDAFPVTFNLPPDKPEARDFCTVPRKVRFRFEPRILVKIKRTTRRHALARAVVALETAFKTVRLGDFVIFQQDDQIVVAGPRTIRLSYCLGKRVEQSILAAFHEWREARRYY